MKEGKKGKEKIPPWKYRLQKEVSKLRQELSLIDAYRRGVITSEQTIRRVKNILRKENTVQNKQITKAMASRKLLIIVKANKIKRYERKEKGKKQNQMFEEDQGRFYRELRNDSIKVSNPPPKEEVERFWKGIYEDERSYNNQAEWLKQIRNNENTTNIERMEHVAITKKGN